MVPCKHLPLKSIEFTTISIVLLFSEQLMALILQPRVASEDRREHLELIPGHEHLVHLSIARKSVANESFVVFRILFVIFGHIKWFVEELEIGYVIANVCGIRCVLGCGPSASEV